MPCHDAGMYLGIGLFALAALGCVFAWLKVRAREREYERGE